MLLPSKVKYRKVQRSRPFGTASRKTYLSFGQFGLKATTTAWVTSRQIEAARRVITHHLQRGGKIWIRIFPDKPCTSKGPEAHMGGGKGPVDHYVAVVKAGTIMFEVDGVALDLAKKALELAAYKLPVRSKFLVKGD